MKKILAAEFPPGGPVCCSVPLFLLKTHQNPNPTEKGERRERQIDKLNERIRITTIKNKITLILNLV